MSDTFKGRWGRLPKRLQVTYLLIVLVVAIGISTFLTLWGTGQIMPLAAPNQASLSISSGDQNYQVGTVFSLQIYLGADTQDQIKKIQLKSFRFDPTMIKVEASGGALKTTPSTLANLHTTVNSVEVDGAGQQTGLINLTMENSGTDYYTGGSARLASINFRVLKAGQAVFSFDAADGLGNGCLVNNSADANILFSAPSGTITLGTQAPEPTASVKSTPTPTAKVSTPTPVSSSKKTTNTTTTTNTTVTSPEASPTLTASTEPTDAGLTGAVKVESAFSKTTIYTYVVIAVGLTLIALLVWYLRNRKRDGGTKSKEDDDDII